MKRNNYANDLQDAELLARAMIDGTVDSLESFIQNSEQHAYQVEFYDKNHRALNQLTVSVKKAKNLLESLNEILESLGRVSK